MREETICTICDKQIIGPVWEWGGEDAHKECVLKTSETICSKQCGYLSILCEEKECQDCGAKMRPITEKDKERYRAMNGKLMREMPKECIMQCLECGYKGFEGEFMANLTKNSAFKCPKCKKRI